MASRVGPRTPSKTNWYQANWVPGAKGVIPDTPLTGAKGGRGGGGDGGGGEVGGEGGEIAGKP